MKKILLSLVFVIMCCSQAFSETPQTPDILSLVATSSTITVNFELNVDEITDGYYIKYWKTSNTDAWTQIRIPKPITTATSYSYLIRGLDNNTEYRVNLTAYDGNDESSYTYRTIETNSVALKVELVASGTLSVSLSEIPSGVETFDVYIGTEPGGVNLDEYDFQLTGIDNESSAMLSGLENGTYYILVQLKNGSGAVISTSDEIAFEVEDFGTLFSSEDIDEGCFINSADHVQTGLGSAMVFISFFLVLVLSRLPSKRLFVVLLTVLVSSSMAQAGETSSSVSDNIIGIKAGFFVPSEKLQDDVYDSIVPVSLFYERRIGSWLSADVSAGYSKTDGFAVTGSDTQTGVKTELELIPVSTSLNANLDIQPLITLYAGFGVDYWMFNEKSYYGDTDISVSGWHGKTGVKLLTGDSNFYARGGVLLEVCYSSMDRFGRNDVDLGGWTYSLAVMYCF
jgi:hypothetical protein